MKKIQLLFVVLFGIFLIGCDDPRPNDWDVDKDDWEVWAVGEITDMKTIHFAEGSRDTNGNILRNYIDYTFNNKKTLSIRQMRNPGYVAIGQIGILYKRIYTANGPGINSWYQFIPDAAAQHTTPKSTKEKQAIPISKKVIFRSDNLTSTKEISSNEIYKWNNYSEIKPDKYLTVLLKLKDGVITTGHLNSINELKLETNRTEIKEGKTISNAVSWKKINLN